MDNKCADLIMEVANDAGFEFDHRPDYSGRGMFSRTTSAISFNSLGQFIACVAEAGYRIAEEEAAVCHRDGEDLALGEPLVTLDEFTQELRDLRQDNIGSQVVLY